jgi:hypothetical protein
MDKERIISFKNFRMKIKPGNKPDSILVIFEGGQDVDGSGWESSAGDRKKVEGDFQFMFSPGEAPSLKKGEYILYFRIPGKEEKFFDWLEKQKKEYFGIEDDK